MRLSLPVLFNRCCRCEVVTRNVHLSDDPFRCYSVMELVNRRIQKEVKTKRLREVRIGETFKKEMHIAEQVTTLYIIGIPVFRKKELFSD